MRETPNSSTTSVDMSTGQDIAVSPNNNKEDNTSNIRGKSKTMKMILLTQCFAGLQLTWSVELAYGTPYLLSLGLSKSLVSLVWLAGPLSGLIMQPIVGLLSDNSTSRFGRRRPFLLAGGFAVVGCFLCIGWTREIVYLFIGKESPMAASLTKWLAIISFYVLDFAINCVQASCRVLIVDNLPPSLQEEGTAWASRMIGIGNVIGYFMGFANLVEIFPFLGKTQMQVLCALASIIILSSDILTCWAVNETVYTGSTNKSKNALMAVYEVLSSIFKSFRNLPNYVQLICNVQFFAWIGWFPFLFYSTTWVAEVHARSTIDSPEEQSEDSVGDSTRAGSFSLLLYSIVSLTASFILPILANFAGKSKTTSSKFLQKQLSKFPMTLLTVPKFWTLSHFIFAFAMLSTWFVTDTFQASILISLCGISWTITMWAPYSILGEFISKESRSTKQEYNLVDSDNDSEDNNEVDTENLRTSRKNSNEEIISDLPLMDSHNDISINHSSHSTEAGVLLGIHNMYIVLPEFLVTFFNSIVFAILEPGGNQEEIIARQRQHHSHPHSNGNLNADAIGFILRFGGLMTIIAGILSIKLWNRKY
ncbi:major facilitator superfamily domain-containing protein [Glomus cerebriforme]|uniref:Major facilitator superfamily domain-containing protein n=1 Tax=Glomus cerebriforme TaxID=658196 RepID=A0A397S6G8_9GLOM|nr:major facilitator superfamily domain-containing protein [Glomus cerebriforme]